MRRGAAEKEEQFYAKEEEEGRSEEVRQYKTTAGSSHRVPPTYLNVEEFGVGWLHRSSLLLERNTGTSLNLLHSVFREERIGGCSTL